MASVLDASAVLALLQKEPGAQIVQQAMGSAVISSVNFLEVASKLGRAHPPSDVLHILEEIQLAVLPFDESQALHAFSIEIATRPYGLSLGDRACLALALSRKLPVLTADKVWAKLDIQVEVLVIR